MFGEDINLHINVDSIISIIKQGMASVFSFATVLLYTSDSGDGYMNIEILIENKDSDEGMSS